MLFHDYVRLTKRFRTQALLADENPWIRAFTVSEELWAANRSPYVKVWPGILPLLLGVDLSDVTASQIEYPEDIICLRFSQDNDLDLECVFVVRLPDTLAIWTTKNGLPTFARLIRFTDTLNVEEPWLRCALGLGLLFSGDLVSREILNRDHGKEITETVLNRARNNGKYGWSIGKDVNPHWRQSHLCKVWYGTGKKLLKIILRKGSIVHREKITVAHGS